MHYIKKAGAVLKDCERELQELGIKALKDGNYEAARRITELAESIADKLALSGLTDFEADAFETSKTSPVTSQPLSPESPTRLPADRSRTRLKGRIEYPRFLRGSEKLIKIGWSKKNKQEYEHNAPWSAVLAFASHLRSHTRPDRIFTIEDILPVHDPQSASDLPEYQVYLALAWFRFQGLVLKRGREGYTTNAEKLTEVSVTQLWNALPIQ